jgi:hypothetical protein
MSDEFLTHEQALERALRQAACAEEVEDDELEALIGMK